MDLDNLPVPRRAKRALTEEEKRLKQENFVRRMSYRSRHAVEAENAAAILGAPLENLHKMKRREYETVMMYLAHPNAHMKDVAAAMGWSSWKIVQRMLRRPHVQALIQKIRDEQVKAVIKGDYGAQAMLKQSQTKAAKKVVETIDDASAGKKLNLAAAESVLDRTGLGKMSAVAHHHVHELLAQMTTAELDRYGRTGEAPARFKEVFEQLEGQQAIDVTPD